MGGTSLRLRAPTQDNRGRGRWRQITVPVVPRNSTRAGSGQIDAVNLGRDMMRHNNDGHRNCSSGRMVGKVKAGWETSPTLPPAEQQATVRRGLGILAKIIARAHLRWQAARSSTAAPGPPPVSRHGERAIPEIGGPE